jgi:predicted transcriptional regulator
VTLNGDLFRHLDFARRGNLSMSTEITKMPDQPPPPGLDRELTTNIVAAYVRHNQIGSDQLGTLISTVHQALTSLGKPAAKFNGERIPAVPIRRSVHRDYVVCLECGWRGQMLRRHIASGHGLTVAQYRTQWNLPREHPITAPGYSERRSGLAKQAGLGQGRRAALPTPETARTSEATQTVTATGRRRPGRPRASRG